MAEVQYQIAGGEIRKEKATTVGQLKTKVGAEGYQATVNGEAEGDSYVLSEYEFVAFAKQVKAGV